MGTSLIANAQTRSFRGCWKAHPDGVVVVDAEGVIRVVNRQTETMFGYAREEMLGHRVEMLLPERFRARHSGMRASYFVDPSTRPMGTGLELIARRKDGTEFPVDISLSPLETEQGVIVSAAVRDATDRKRGEKERELLGLQQSQRLESLGQLAGGVAHDFNNLLAAILNYAGLIADDPGAETVRSDVQEIIRAGERAATLTHQLLIFGRREVVKPEILDINAIVGDLEKMLSRTVGEHIEIRTKLTPDVWPVKADPTGVDQVLMNLIINARDALHEGGVISIETTNVDFSSGTDIEPWALPPGRYACMTVTDDGIGMAPDVVVRAFEPFFTTKAKAEGTGLGLATVHGIVTQAGGDVRIYSEPGMGTVVRVYLPASSEAKAEPAVEDVPIQGGVPGATILLVEDEPQVRESTARVLATQGYVVLSAPAGAEGLAIARSHAGPIDLLVTDVVMPVMSGVELADKMQSIRPNTMILLMSGYPQDVLGRGAASFGFPLIEKPFSSEQLLRRLRSMLEGRRANRSPALGAER
ncbi:MAG: ATP-binding protein [Actinomycetota bacterium]